MTTPPAVPAVTDARELTLVPIDGMARYLGPTLFKLVFRLISMVEVPERLRFGNLLNQEGFFLRDRHVHPVVEKQGWTLKIENVASPREFTYDELAALPQSEQICVTECAGNGNHLMGSAGLVGQMRWKGPSFKTLIEACGGPGPSTHFVCRGCDGKLSKQRGYHYGLSYEELCESGALVALTANGEPLNRYRGFPARLVVPGIYSMSHVKWLIRIEGLTQPHDGFYNRIQFTNKRLTDGRWERVEARWIFMKSLITRCAQSGGDWVLEGWAWGGGKQPAKVEVTTDGGQTWEPAELTRPGELFGSEAGTRHAWTLFRYVWKAPAPGRYRLASRATDPEGIVQPEHLPEEVEKGHFNQYQIKWRDVVVP